MSIIINYKNSASKRVSDNLVLFVDENFRINALRKYISPVEFSYISDLLEK